MATDLTTIIGYCDHPLANIGTWCPSLVSNISIEIRGPLAKTPVESQDLSISLKRENEGKKNIWNEY